MTISHEAAQQEMTFYRNVTALTGNPLIGLQVGAEYHFPTYGILGYALMRTPTLRQAINRSAQKVMEHFYDEITEELQEGIQGIQGTRNRLHFVIWHHLNVVNTNAALCGVILRESRGLGKAFMQDIYRLNRNYTNSLNQIIKEGIATGGD